MIWFVLAVLAVAWGAVFGPPFMRSLRYHRARTAPPPLVQPRSHVRLRGGWPDWMLEIQRDQRVWPKWLQEILARLGHR